MPSNPPASACEVIDSWKEIAAYLKRDVRTVMRWEHTRGLPVRRLPGGPKSAVYATKPELDAWRESAGNTFCEERAQPEHSSSSSPAPSIAVLPFVNLSSEKQNEYFSDGLTDEIITALSRIEGLRVIARTSSFGFRGKEQDVREIGALLDVGTLLEGSVQRADGRVRISAQLVSCSDGHHIWAERYDRDLTNVFATQEEIAACIATALKVKVQPQASRKRTPNGDAYFAWLKGRHYQFNRRTLQDVIKARECFSQAIEYDPDFGAAHLAVAQGLLEAAVWGMAAPREVAAAVRTGVEKALQWDDRLGEAHAALGTYRALFDFDWPGAESAFEQALAREPGSPAVLRAPVACLLAPTSRLEAAEEESARALELDPLCPDAHFLLALMLFFRRQYDRAEASIRASLELGSDNPVVQWVAGMIAVVQGRFDEAISTCENAVRMLGSAPILSAGLGMVYGWSGRSAEARNVLRQIEQAAAAAYVSPIYRAWIYMGLGEIDNVFYWLDRAIECRDPHILHLPVKPVYDALRTDPRFSALPRKMQLPYSSS